MFRLVVILQIAVAFRSELYFAVLNMVSGSSSAISFWQKHLKAKATKSQTFSKFGHR